MSTADISRKEKYSRCVALEEDYVHQVYETIGRDLAHAKDPLEETVNNFLDDLEPGSLVADIGCGNGSYLRDKGGIMTIGADNSSLQISFAQQRCQEAILGDNLRLPFRGDTFDAALSVGVLHHFTTKQRRIKALKELARILKIGGRALITVQWHNTQTSQDVLIPWFDVPKDRKKKDKCQFQENSEYDLGDAIYLEDDEEEDSISLPSSDEDDAPLSNYAKLFSSKQCHDKHDWNSEDHTRSLNCNCEITSDHVPNTKQLVQPNACYAFVQKAFKRFSSVNNDNEDQYFISEPDHRVNSAVLLSPSNGQEQKYEFFNCSSFNLNETVQKTISDNFIELLNIDDEQDTSSFHTGSDCTCDFLYEVSSRIDSPVKNKGTLTRSLSHMFKNMNSLWSSKGAKSCADLKSNTVTNVRNRKVFEDNRSRLVRSKTIATCNPEFVYKNILENIDEQDMTVGEANKIINDFIDSSIPKSETIKSEICNTGDKTLTQSDIVNGNTLTCYDEDLPRSNSKSKCKKHMQNEYTNRYSIEEENIRRAKALYEINLLEKALIFGFDDYDFIDKALLTYQSQTDLFSKKYSDSSDVYSVDKKRKYSNNVDFCDFEIEKFLTDEINLKSILKEEYNFLCEGELDNCDMVKLKRKTAFLNTNIEKSPKYDSYNTIIKNETKPFRMNDDYMYPLKSLKFETLDKSQLNSKREEKDLGMANLNTITLKKTTLDENKKNKQPIASETQQCNLQQEKNRGKEETCLDNTGKVNSKCTLQKSPKKLRKSKEAAKSKELVQFYDEDNDSNYAYEDSTLSSYYSMPELHALSEFYQEYSIYQNYLYNNGNFSTQQDNYYLRNESILSSNQKSKTKLKNDIQNFERTTNPPLTSVSHIDSYEITNLLTENQETEINSFLKPNASNESSVCEDKINLDNINTSKITPYVIDSKPQISLPVLLEEISIPDIQNKCRDKICSKSKNVQDRDFDISTFCSQNKILRSCSVSSLPDSLNLKKSEESSNLSDLWSSQPSLALCIRKDYRSNPVLNRLRINQKMMYQSASSNIVVDKADSTYVSEYQFVGGKGSYNKRSVDEGNDDISISVPNNVSIKDLSGSYPTEHVSPKKLRKLSKTDDQNTSILSLNKVEEDTYSKICSISPKHIKKQTSNSYFLNTGQNTERCKKTFKLTEKSESHENAISIIKSLIDDEVKEYAHNILDKKSSTTFSEDAKLDHTSRTSDFCSRNSSKVNFSQVNSSDALSLFPSQNISKTDAVSSSPHHIGFIHPENDAKNGAEINDKLSGEKKSILDVSLVVLPRDFNKTVNEEDEISNCQHPNSVMPMQNSKNNCLDDTTTSYQESVNYVYGRVTEDNVSVVGHRYHHLFQEEELHDLIEYNISDLHVLSSFLIESHLCIIAEKVRVWTI